MINASLRFKLPHEVPFLVVHVSRVWSNTNESVPVVCNLSCDFIDCNKLSFDISHSSKGKEEDRESISVQFTFEGGVYELLAVIHLHC